MNSRFVALLLSLTALALVAPSAHAQKVKIEVRAGWQGLAHARHSKFVIKGLNGTYRADGKTLDSSAVEAFLAAVRDRPLHAISADACGLNQAWVTANVDRAFALLTPELPHTPSPAQEAFFRSQFTPANVQAYLDSFKNIRVADDDTDIELKVTVDSDVIIIDSGSDLQFLLPWRDSEDEHTTFNCQISTTLGAILPSHFLNRERLLPESPRFLREVAEFVIRGKETEWDALGPSRYPK